MELQKNKERETNPKSPKTEKKLETSQSVYAIKSKGKREKETYLKRSNHKMQKAWRKSLEQIGEEEAQSND